ncbi:twin-arginine translocation signal domain-containing protein, partial [Bradyrhizobium sp.]
MILEKSTALSRRTFIVGSAAIAGGGLAVGMSVPFAEQALAE